MEGVEERHKRSLIMAALMALFLCSVLAALGGVLWMIRNLPVMAAHKYGPSSPDVIGASRLILSYRLLNGEEELLQPVDPTGPVLDFIVEENEHASGVSRRLEVSGLIRSANLFDDYLVYTGQDTSIQAGVHQLSAAMNALQIAYALQDATPSEIEFGILDGWRLEEIAESIASYGLDFDGEAFIRATQNPDPAWLPPGIPFPNSLEGYLLPGIYLIPRGATVDVLVPALTQSFSERVTPEMIAAYEQRGLTLAQAVTLASIVEREAVVVDEQPLIAAVFLNRLKIGMKLESDPTIQYAIGYDSENQTWWKNPLTGADLMIDSPYNTYVYVGLPPRPICSPDISALEAVAYPDGGQMESTTPFLYFRSACDGSGRHQFAVTFEEHLLNECP